jgi:hypothetical protein
MGKFRHLGITETSPNDYEQRMLQRAVHDGVWEVLMLAFNLMHHLVAGMGDVADHALDVRINDVVGFYDNATQIFIDTALPT